MLPSLLDQEILHLGHWKRICALFLLRSRSAAERYYSTVGSDESRTKAVETLGLGVIAALLPLWYLGRDCLVELFCRRARRMEISAVRLEAR
jgi:hypothetical protein